LTYFIINKRDLWNLAPVTEKAEFEQFYKDQVETWRQAKRSNHVDFRIHSNDIPDDVAQLMGFLKQTMKANCGD